MYVCILFNSTSQRTESTPQPPESMFIHLKTPQRTESMFIHLKARHFIDKRKTLHYTSRA